MHPLTPYLYLAGALHIAVIVANASLPRRLQTREHLSRLTLILRQVFYVHWIYILFVLAGIAALCFFFPADLSETRLGRSLSAFLAVFWFLRAAIQLFYYDRTLKRQHPFLNAAFILTVFYFGCVFTAAALWPFR